MKKYVLVKDDKWSGIVDFYIDNEPVARVTRHERFTWGRGKIVWNVKFDLETTKALSVARPHYNMALKENKGYSGGAYTKREAVAHVKSSLRTVYGRGKLDFGDVPYKFDK
jgi:hypothetical protein